MKVRIECQDALTEDQRRQVQQLRQAVREHDGVDPFNDAGRLGVRGERPAVHWFAVGEELLGYAQTDPEHDSAVLCVHPQHRREGIGTRLVQSIRAQGDHLSWWALGNQNGARGFADRIGFNPQRQLLIMERPLTEPPRSSSPASGVEIRPAADAGDLDAVVRVNALAFADHPEQGAMTRSDLDGPRAQEWFNPADLLLAVQGDEVVGFHWTKLVQETDKTVGEVYVIGVLPTASGQGIGRVLLEAGLLHLHQRGAQRARLYVEAEASRTVAMYSAAGFEVVWTDTQYS